MSRSLSAFAIFLLLGTLALTPALAVDDTPTAATAPMTPMMADITAALQVEQAQVAALAAQLATAPDDAAALELHRAIEQAKMDGQLQVLGIQARYARAEGRVEDATKLEAAMATMGHTAVPANVEQRAAPNADAAGR
jgi:hypothetical protein